MKKPLAYVTDHAVLRFLERVRGVDVEAARCELGQKVDAALEAGASATIVNGIRYVLVGGTLVSCVPVKSTPPMAARTAAVRAKRRTRNEPLHPILSGLPAQHPARVLVFLARAGDPVSWLQGDRACNLR